MYVKGEKRDTQVSTSQLQKQTFILSWNLLWPSQISDAAFTLFTLIAIFVQIIFFLIALPLMQVYITVMYKYK